MTHLLVADDDQATLFLTTKILEREGYHVHAVENGVDAYEALTASDAPDIAVLDWMMPGFDGVEVCRRLQRDLATQNIYVILLTARGSRDDLVAAFDAGASDYIVKPYRAYEVLARVRSAERIGKLKEQLIQARKMKSLGHLVFGIAHEINTPAQFVIDNTRFLGASFSNLMALLRQYEETMAAVPPEMVSRETMALLKDARETADFDFMDEEIPEAIEQVAEGMARIIGIVHKLKEYEVPDSETSKPCDINRILNEIVSRFDFKQGLQPQVIFDPAPNLPMITGSKSRLRRALTNIITNAVDALLEVDGNEAGTINISTAVADGCVEARISDTGSGISPQIKNRIFDPFFTTRSPTERSGQGLSVARSILVDHHGGEVTFHHRDSGGTTFVVRLPVADDPPFGATEKTEVEQLAGSET